MDFNIRFLGRDNICYEDNWEEATSAVEENKVSFEDLLRVAKVLLPLNRRQPNHW